MDAIVSEIYPALRLADVKIQGSNNPIVAHYPLNWQTAPIWLKKGNSVKINFVGGDRGRIELIAHGSAIPTVISEITGSTADDGLLSGGEGFAQDPPSMTVDVGAGTARINGETYSFEADSVTLDAAPSAGYYRIDLIVVGTDGVLDYVKGTQATSDPVAPSVPANHVEVRRVLLYNANTAIYQYMVGQTWTDPEPTSLEITLSATYMEWNVGGDHIHIHATVLDQYGQDLTPAAAGMDHYDFTISWLEGNGNIDAVASPTPVTHSGVTTADTDFEYTRDNLVTDEGPTFEITVNSEPTAVDGNTQIELRDADGNPMWGEPNWGEGDVSGPASAVEDNLASFGDATGKLIEDSGIAKVDAAAAIAASHAAATAGTGISIDGQEISLTERNANLTLYPEYAGATMGKSGSDNLAGTEGMTSDSEVVSNVRHNYYEWSSSIATGLQSYDILVQIPIPHNFTGFQAGASVAFTLDIKTEENTTTNNKLDVTINRDGQAATSSLTAQKSSVADTWETIGFDETDTVLAAVVAGETLNVAIRMYSQSSKYTRIGKINLQIKVQ